MNICFQHSFQRAFGTFPLRGEVLRTAVADALDVGYRAFDTAQMYGNEADVGAALDGCGVERDDLCVITKVHPDNYTEAAFLPSVERSLTDLRLSHVDLLLLHWPPVGGDIAASVRLLNGALRRGLTRNIGVSNYTAAMMRRARDVSDAALVTNQVEFHPLLDQSALLAAADGTGIPLSSYSSVARGEVFRHPLFAEIGAGYGKSAAQVVLRWVLQTGLPLTTMSTRRDNIAANFDIMDFTLSSVDMRRIDAMRSTGHRVVRKGAVPWTPDWD